MQPAETAQRQAADSSTFESRPLTAWWPWAAAALSGVLLALCLAPWNLTGLCWFALTPLICAVWLSRGSGLRQALLGYIAGIVFFTAAFYWLSSLGTLFGQAWLHGLPFYLALYMGLYLAFWAWFIARLVPADSRHSSLRNLRIAFLGACAWVAHEWVRGWLFSGFGWNNLGVALHGELAMIQIVDLTGVAGLSFLVAFVNLMAVIVVRRLVSELGPNFLRKMRWEFTLTVALIVAVFAYGTRKLLRPDTTPTTSIRVAAVQPNIPQSDKFSREAEDEVFAQLGKMSSLAAALQPDLLVWPEAAVPRGMFADETNYRFVMEHAAQGDFGLLIGSVDLYPEGDGFNVATLLTDRGANLQTYRKMHLVPFGEYLPMRWFPLFAMVAGGLVPADFARGTEFTVLRMKKPEVNLAALICFEDTLGDLTRRFVLNGAQVLVNITNDGWFLETAAAEQHLANAVFRAVENRRPLVRCANTGVTCSIDRDGRVDRHRLKTFEQGLATMQVQAPPASRVTFYTQHGEWLTYGASGVTGAALVGFAVAGRRRKSG